MGFVPKFARGSSVTADEFNFNMREIERSFALMQKSDPAATVKIKTGTSPSDPFPANLGMVAYNHSQVMNGTNPHRTYHDALEYIALAGYNKWYGHISNQAQDIYGVKSFFDGVKIDFISPRTGNITFLSTNGNPVAMVTASEKFELVHDMSVSVDEMIDLFSESIRPRYIYGRKVYADYSSITTLQAFYADVTNFTVNGITVDPNDLVHKSGSEEITGAKQFTSSVEFGKTSAQINSYVHLFDGKDATNGGKTGHLFYDSARAVKGVVGYRSGRFTQMTIINVNDPVMIGQKPNDGNTTHNNVIKIGKRDSDYCGIWHGSYTPNTLVTDWTNYSVLIGPNSTHINAPGGISGNLGLKINGTTKLNLTNDSFSSTVRFTVNASVLPFQVYQNDVLLLSADSSLFDVYGGVRAKSDGDQYGRTILSGKTGSISFGPGGLNAIDCAIRRTGASALQFDADSLGFFSVTPVLKSSRGTLMTNQSTGTIATTIPEWNATWSVTNAQSITRSLGARIAWLEYALRGYGLI